MESKRSFRLITNELYTGKVINGKQEVADFLTGQRKEKDETEWFVIERPEFRIIDDETFEKAQRILASRYDSFNISHERQSNKYLFSTLIKCKDCGWSFRRTVRTYKNTYVRWVCSGHNGNGADSCPNAVSVDEEDLIQALQEYFQDMHMDMYADDLITRDELNEKIGGMRKEIERLENELRLVSYNLTKGDQLETILNNTFKEIEDIADVHEMTNEQLKRIVRRIVVDKDGNVDIYLRVIGDLGLEDDVLIENEKNSSIMLRPHIKT